MRTRARRRSHVAAAALMVCVAAGCSSSAPPTSAPHSTPSTSPSTLARAAVRGITKPSTLVSLARRQIARVTVANPDALVAALGYIWVKTDDGRVVKVDPRSNRVVAQRKLDTARDSQHYCQGIGTDGRSVWVCAARDTATDVVRIDPHSLRPVVRVAADKAFDQEHLPYVAGRLWVLSSGGRRLLAVSPTTSVLTAYPLPATACAQAAGSGTVLIVTCPTDNVVLRVDPTRGTILAHRTLRQPRYCTVSSTQVWVDTSDGIQRMDDHFRPTAVYAGLTVGLTGDLASDPSGVVWVRHEQGFLYRIDPTRNAVVEQVRSAIPVSGGSILVTTNAIWTSAYDDNTVYHLRR